MHFPDGGFDVRAEGLPLLRQRLPAVPAGVALGIGGVKIPPAGGLPCGGRALRLHRTVRTDRPLEFRFPLLGCALCGHRLFRTGHLVAVFLVLSRGDGQGDRRGAAFDGGLNQGDVRVLQRGVGGLASIPGIGMQFREVRRLLLHRLHPVGQDLAVVCIIRGNDHIRDQIQLVVGMTGLGHMDHLAPALLTAFFPIRGVGIVRRLQTVAPQLLGGAHFHLLRDFRKMFGVDPLQNLVNFRIAVVCLELLQQLLIDRPQLRQFVRQRLGVQTIQVLAGRLPQIRLHQVGNGGLVRLRQHPHKPLQNLNQQLQSAVVPDIGGGHKRVGPLNGRLHLQGLHLLLRQGIEHPLQQIVARLHPVVRQPGLEIEQRRSAERRRFQVPQPQGHPGGQVKIDMLEQLGVGPAPVVQQDQRRHQRIDGRIGPAACLRIEHRKVFLGNLAEDQLVELIVVRLLQLLALAVAQMRTKAEQFGLGMRAVGFKHGYLGTSCIDKILILL